MRTRQVVVGDASLTIREWGKPANRALVHWHGLTPLGALELNEAGPAWAADGFHVVAIAAPGIADPDSLRDLSAYRPKRLADLVVAVADESRLGRFAFAGSSWGASIGVHLAAQHPKRLDALVLLDAGHTDIPDDLGRTLDQVQSEMSRQQERYRFPDWNAFLSAVRERSPHWRPALEERFRAGMREENDEIVPCSDPRAAAAAWYGLLEEQPSSAHEALGRTRIPVLLVIATENDTTAEVERFRVQVPQLETREIESGHDLMADAADATIRVVSEWLRSISAGPH